jgi:hypothetical protein
MSTANGAASSPIDTLGRPVTEIRERIAVAAGVAILVAGLILVAIVLPAEYGVDPLGTGARLGLVELGQVGQQVEALDAAAASGTQGGQATIIMGQERPFTSETVDFVIGPREGMEYKYRLEKGKALLYTWKATAPVNYELHAEPDGGPRGYAQSYEKRDATREASGTLTAPFTGIHGWFWENTTGQPVTVTLQAAGFYNLAHEFRADGVKNKTFK